MNEAYFEKAYEKYKNLVIKYLVRKGVEITNIMHTIDSYVRDFYLDKFKAYECADAIYDNVQSQVKTENYNGDDGMTLEEAMEIVTKHGFGVKRMDEGYGDAAGTQLSDIIEEFISGNNQTGISKAEQILRATGRIDQVKAEFIDAIKPCVGHGLSSIVRIPPPTVKGMNTSLATRSTTSSMVSRPSFVAVISKKTSSSAPSCEYFFARATGSPAYLKLSKLTPLTVCPSLTSKQGMIRFVSMFLNPDCLRPSGLMRHNRPVRFFRGGTGLRQCCFFERRP